MPASASVKAAPLALAAESASLMSWASGLGQAREAVKAWALALESGSAMATGTRLVKGARAWSTQSFCGLELERSDVADRAGGAVAVLRSGHPTLVGGGRRTIRAADIDCRAAGQQGVGLGGAAVYIRPGLVDRPLFFALQSMVLGENSLLARLGQGRSGRGDATPF